MAGQSYLQAPTDGSGKKIDTQVTTTAAQHRQVMVIGAKDTDANVAPVDATKGLAVDLSATGANSNKLLVTPDSVALPANQSVNQAQVAGTATDTNSGNKSAGTQRVVLATDQPALTNKLLTTPDLPSGASTSAKQDTGNTSLSSIDGKITAVNTGAVVVSSSALPSGAATEATLAGAIKAEDAASADGDKGIPALAVRKATPANTSGTDGDYENLQVSAGRLWASATIDAALPAGTAAIGKLAANAGVTIGAVEIAAAQTLATVTNVATIGTSVTPGTAAANLGKAEDAVHSSGDTGVAVLAVRDDTLNPTSGTEGDYEMLHTTADGALWVTQAPSTSNGWSTFMASSGDGSTALTATAQAVKASAGTLGGWYIYNPNATATYVIIYNTAQGSVTVGTTNPQMVLCIPATSAANVEFGNGINFTTAISVAATTTGGGNTAPSTALEANFYYK